MNRSSFTILLMAGSLLGACSTAMQMTGTTVASARLYQANGAPAGTALLTRRGEYLTLSISLLGTSPGVHGMHLHKTGKCDAPDFASAGAHLNPASRQHGKDNPAGSHLGDLPNINVRSNGVDVASQDLNGPASDLLPAIFDADGTAIVIHATADDYRTDPTGNSGARIACGVLVRS
jgi:superoxide dismutase, Cu-Zn family